MQTSVEAAHSGTLSEVTESEDGIELNIGSRDGDPRVEPGASRAACFMPLTQ